MRQREIGWTIALVGLPFAHLLFRPLDPWHGQALWWQLNVLLLWAWTMAEGGTVLPNRPLGWLIAWLSIQVIYAWTKTIIVQKIYPLPMLQSIMHLLLILFAYHAMTMSLTSESLLRLSRWLTGVLFVLLAYSLLQWMDLDQFFKPLATNGKDEIVGTIGNPSHLAAQLAILLPWVWIQRFWIRWIGIGGCLMLLFFCHSVGGLLAGLAAGWVLIWFLKPRWRIGMVICTVSCGLFGYLQSHALDPHGRWQAWTAFYHIFHQQPITGFGPGFIMELSRMTPSGSPIFNWRHVHNEFFQIAIEWGLIGLGLFLWLCMETLNRFWQAEKTPVTVACAASLAALLVNSLVNFPFHLASLGAYGLLAYVGICLSTPKGLSC